MAKKIWVLGSGSFGIRAVRTVKRHLWRQTASPLWTPAPRHWIKATVIGINKVCEEGAAFLHRNLSESERPDWIVPALPIHLAWEWVLLELGQNRLGTLSFAGNLGFFSSQRYYR